MPTELIITVVVASATALVALGAALAARAERAQRSADAERAELGLPVVRGDTDDEPTRRTSEGALRVLWWLTIAVVLVSAGASGAFDESRAVVFGVGGGAALVVVLLHELLPAAARGRLAHLLEALAALGLTTALIAFTGYGASVFATLFALVAVAAALAHGARAGIATAALGTLAYAGVLLADPAGPRTAIDDVLRAAINLAAIWLLTFLAAAYVTHQRRAVARAVALSRTDPLTGLANRSQLLTTLEQEVSRTRRSDRGFCVLMIDLDGLKAINDTVGHHRGDDVLRRLGNIIVRSIRGLDSAHRYGGDEFVVLLPETDIVGAFVVAEKIRAGAEEMVVGIGPGDDPIASVSIGLVSHPEDGATAEELMFAADRAMYQAKAQGKNQISGNPRPRRLIARSLPPPAAPPPVAASPPAVVEVEPATARDREELEVSAPPADRAVAVDLSWDDAARPGSPAGHQRPRPAEAEEDQPDPAEVRRQIAAAKRTFDPDHQIRRAMDAFLSPVPSERRGPPSDA